MEEYRYHVLALANDVGGSYCGVCETNDLQTAMDALANAGWPDYLEVWVEDRHTMTTLAAHA